MQLVELHSKSNEWLSRTVSSSDALSVQKLAILKRQDENSQESAPASILPAQYVLGPASHSPYLSPQQAG